jgi:hypothetical protein
MKKLLTLIMVLCSTSAYADWSLKPFAQLAVGLDYVSTHHTDNTFQLHTDVFVNGNDTTTINYYLPKGEFDENKFALGVTPEIGGEFRYDWFYSALSVSYDTAFDFALNVRLGFKYEKFTPYLKAGIGYGSSFGGGATYEYAKNIFWVIEYDMKETGVEDKQVLDPYNSQYVTNDKYKTIYSLRMGAKYLF